MFDPTSNKFFIYWDVVFHEDIFPFRHITHTSTPPDIFGDTVISKPILEPPSHTQNGAIATALVPTPPPPDMANPVSFETVNPSQVEPSSQQCVLPYRRSTQTLIPLITYPTPNFPLHTEIMSDK